MFDKIVITFGVLLGAFLAYLLFILLPVSMYTDAECLAKGYPKALVSIGLSRYCTTVDGAVTVKVDKQ